MRLFHCLVGYFVKNSLFRYFSWDEGTIGSQQNEIVLMRIPGEMTATVTTVAFWWHGGSRRMDLVLAAVGA